MNFKVFRLGKRTVIKPIGVETERREREKREYKEDCMFMHRYDVVEAGNVDFIFTIYSHVLKVNMGSPNWKLFESHLF